MVLAERADDLARLRSLLDDARQHRGSGVVVSGPVASGKTELLNTAADEAVKQGATLATALCFPADKTTPLGMFGQLLLDCPLATQTRRRAIELLAEARARIHNGDLASEHVQQVSTAVAHSLCSLLTDLATHPLLLVVDDAQYADVPSLQCLLLLVRKIRWTPVVLAIGRTTPVREPHPLIQAELLRQLHSHRIRLTTLSETGVAEVIAARTSTGAADALASSVHSVSGGNPLLVRALLEDQNIAGRTTAKPDNRPGVAVGESFEQAVISCLYRSDDIARTVAYGIAVLGDGPDLGILSELTEFGPQVASSAVQRLDEAGLLAGARFRHPNARAAIIKSLSEKERATMHRTAAQLLHHRGHEPSVVAEHLVEAGDAAAPWAVPVLQQAADQALRDDRPQQAVRYLEHARVLCTDERARAGLLGRVANIEWRLNPAAVLRRLDALTSAMRSGLLDAERAASLLGHLLWHGYTEEAVEVATALQKRAADPEWSEEATTAWRSLALWFPSILGRLSTRFAASPAPAGAEPRHRAAEALHAVFTRGTDADVITAAEQVLRATRLADNTVDAICTSLYALVYSDRFDKAVPWYETLQDEASQQDAPGWQALLHAAGAEIAFRQGDLGTTEYRAQAALRYLAGSSWGTAIGSPLGSLVLALTAMGRYGEASDLLEQPFPAWLLHTRAGLPYRFARGQYNLATHAFHEAIADFRACGDLMTEWRLDLPALVPWRSSAAEAYLQLGQRSAAKKLAAEQLARCKQPRSRSRGVSLRVLAATSDPRHRQKLLREAEAVLQSCGDRLELAKVLTDLSAARRDADRVGQARSTVRRALLIAKELRAEPLCQRLLPQPADDVTVHTRRIPKSTVGAGSLTEAEWRVARLAAQGHTNTEIAGKLYITVSTVEQHLTRAYRKLNISRRTELPARLRKEIGAPMSVG
ncbi:ATP-binding protein [Prauserella cavernicola]|uniref:AAA family ATPase n=1 Tax=Prauserella cavernicola TaxID=2800127 RepID=A0A934QYS4_9PSEU|nr:LuxR family transcriptional regulator [Prauserella cavernicola]MBK1787999.1 AAA family ATPase [Prauserella cavernicola]